MDIETACNKALDYLYSFVDYSLKHSSELAKAEFTGDYPQVRACHLDERSEEKSVPRQAKDFSLSL